MNKNEVVQFLAILNTHYHSAFKNFDERMLKAAIESWHLGLRDLDASLVFNVLAKFTMVDETDFPPKLATIRKEVLKLTNPNSLIPAEIAFEIARKTVIKYGRYNKEKGLNSIENPSVKRALIGIGWDRIGDASNETIGYVKADFIKLYDDVDRENKEEALLPKGSLKKLQEMAQQKQIEQKNEMS